MRAGLEGRKGIIKVDYDATQDLFHVQFDPELINKENILSTIWTIGRTNGQEYLPTIMPDPSDEQLLPGNKSQCCAP